MQHDFENHGQGQPQDRPGGSARDLRVPQRSAEPRVITPKPRSRCAIGLHDRASVFAIDDSGVATGTCRYCQCRLKRLPWSRQWFCADRMG